MFLSHLCYAFRPVLYTGHLVIPLLNIATTTATWYILLEQHSEAGFHSIQRMEEANKIAISIA